MEQDFRTTFLVLEDDASDALLIRRAFTNAACNAFVCRNTSEARAYLVGAGMYGERDRFPFPDIFMTDLRLGDESGIQFIEWVRSKPELKDLPIIILSGKATGRDVSAAKALGVSRVWQKPSDPIVLQSMIQELSKGLCGGEELVTARARRATPRR